MARRSQPLMSEGSVETIKRVPVANLAPYARNSRTHSDEQIAKIAASIREFGFLNPVITDGKNGIIAGHGRVLAAQLLGLAELPCIEAAHLTEAQRRAYVIADNRIAIDAGWDNEMLKIELSELQGLNFDLALTGFSLDEAAGLILGKTGGQTDPDEAPEPEALAVSQAGDIWQLGAHRIICGSSTDPATVAALLGDERPHLMVTDPPYGVNYDAAWRQRAGVGGSGSATGVVLNDDRADWSEAWVLFPGAVAYVWHGGLHSPTVAASLQSARFEIRAQIIWHKPRFALSRGHYHWQHEPAWYGVRCGEKDHWTDQPEPRFVDGDHEVVEYAVRKGEGAHWCGGRKQSTIWTVEHLKSETGHSTQKPVECMKRPIENNSKQGDAVYEPFSGSGTTIIAGEMTGRRVLAVELSPAYVDVAVRRWQQFTGRQAVHAGSGRPFDEIAAEANG